MDPTRGPIEPIDIYSGIENPLTRHKQLDTSLPSLPLSQKIPTLQSPGKIFFKATKEFSDSTSGVWNAVKFFFLSRLTNIKASAGADLVRESEEMGQEFEKGGTQYSTVLEVQPHLFSPAGIKPGLFESKAEIWANSVQSKLAARHKMEYSTLQMYTGYEAVPYGTNGENLVKNRVIPTGLKTPHLENIHVTKTGEGVGVLRTAVVNSKTRAEEFVQAIRVIQDKSETPLRVVSHQLNSYENNEDAFVKNQHKQMARITRDHKIPVAHINTPTNRFYNVTRLFEGTFLEPVVNFFLPGEKKSHKQNIEGLSQMAAWVMEDMNRPEDQAVLSENAKVVRNCYARILDIQEALKNNPNDPKAKELKNEKQELHQRITRLRADMRQNLIDFRTSINQMGDAAPLKAKLMVKLIDSQLRLDNPIPRAQEVLIIKLLNKELNVISATNCKSGLDRTGFAHAVEIALFQLYKKYEKQDIENLVLNWDKISKDHFTPGKPKSNILNEMQNYVLMNLIDAGIPITQRSTGLLGLKWHSGKMAQLVPLEFIPATITSGGNTVTLVKYENGAPTGLTDMGHRLLTKLQKFRGA